MTDRLNGFTVVLIKPTRDDDAEVIRQAIGALRGVASVAPVVQDPESYTVRIQEQMRMRSAILEAITGMER